MDDHNVRHEDPLQALDESTQADAVDRHHVAERLKTAEIGQKIRFGLPSMPGGPSPETLPGEKTRIVSKGVSEGTIQRLLEDAGAHEDEDEGHTTEGEAGFLVPLGDLEGGERLVLVIENGGSRGYLAMMEF